MTGAEKTDETDETLAALWASLTDDDGWKSFDRWSILADRYEDLGIEPDLLATLRWMVVKRKRPVRLYTTFLWFLYRGTGEAPYPSDLPESVYYGLAGAKTADWYVREAYRVVYPTPIEAVRDLARALKRAGETTK